MGRAELVAACLYACVFVLSPALGHAGEVDPEGPRIIVKYKRHADDLAKESSRRRHGATRVKDLRDFKMECVKGPSGARAEELLSQYAADPAVEYAEADHRVYALAVPSDPQFAGLWGLRRIGGPAAWDVSTGDPSVVVAVVDSGVDHNHEDLRGNVWVNEAERLGVPGRDDDGNGYLDDVYGYNAVQNGGDPTDEVGHGTHVAGTIGAVADNGLGVAGVNWNVKVLACKFMDSTGAGYASDAIECLQYVKAMKDRGVNVVASNNSWGGGPYSRATEDAVRGLGDILFVAAAGNDGASNDATPTYPASYDLPNVISVAAVDSADGLATFSNRGGRTVHVGAPGVDILSTLPGSVYGSMSGTSMASPHVAGLAALIRARHPTLDWRATKNLILSSGESLPALAASTATGKEINAAAALACAGRSVFAVLKAPAFAAPGSPATLSALSVDCAQPLGPVTVRLPDGQAVTLSDDGVAPDLAEGDGVFSATWIPVRPATTLLFASPAGSETVALR